MPSESVITEFISIVEDTREQLTYLHELGVVNIETGSQLSSPLSDAIPSESKEIRAQSPSESYPRPVNKISSDTPTANASAIFPRPKLSVTSPPAGTLFGDLAPPAPVIEKSSESIEQIWSDIGDCTRCPLHERRTNIVHTEGNRRARLMFVGEAPGADEDEQARPFVGRAGQLLTKIIEAIGFKREDVLIGNVNRCRPPGNRPPTSEEASMCKPFLLREIAAVQPEVIVVLGNTAMRNLLDIKQGITRVRGQFQDYHGVKVMPTFHPAYLLRDPSKKQETWQDLKKVRDYLETTPRREN
jgi:uracil-DNA glycosylase